MNDEVDPRTLEDPICGVTEIGPTGIEWVCIKKPHASIYIRKTGDKTHRRGEFVFSNNSSVDNHYFVNRWPNRKVSNEED